MRCAAMRCRTSDRTSSETGVARRAATRTRASFVMISPAAATAAVAPESGRHHRRASSAGSYSGVALLSPSDDDDDDDDDGDGARERDENGEDDGDPSGRRGGVRGVTTGGTAASGAMASTGARGDGAAADVDGDVDGASEAKTDTPGKGLPWSPRLASVIGDERAKIKARSRREGRGSDADVITQFLGDETSEATTTTTTAAGSTSRTREKSHNKSTSSSSPWSTLVSYLRCCVVPKTQVLESELEGVGAEDAEAEAKSVSPSSSAATCVPCTSQPRVCFNENFTLHSGDPFIGERALGCAKPCLVLDLDETLVHSSFKPVLNPDYVVPVEIDGKMTDVHVLKRPWVDLFMREVAKDWEIVLFTASLPKYADPVLDLLDATKTISWRLFRRHCYAFQGNYVKDLTCLGRDLKKTVIVDNSPFSYAFHPQNAFPITSFIDNPNDNELLNAIPYLRELAHSEDVTRSLHRNRGYLPRQSYFARKGCEPPTLNRLGQSI